MNKTLYLLIVLLLIGCATSIDRVARIVKKFKLDKEVITGNKYQHLLISNHFNGEILHIYIEGDGVPWSNRYTISKDPTPGNPLALKLMSQDANLAIYIGRPCYFGNHSSFPCSETQWTNGRYGEDIIDSMEVAINSYITHHKINKIILIGYSGGSVIASLLANRMPETQLYITIAGNLDIKAWTNYHGYSELDQSLNPTVVLKNKDITGVHLMGKKDSNVPPHLNEQFIKQTDGIPIIFPNFDHICCWEQNWNDTLIKIKSDSLNITIK